MSSCLSKLAGGSGMSSRFCAGNYSMRLQVLHGIIKWLAAQFACMKCVSSSYHANTLQAADGSSVLTSATLLAAGERRRQQVIRWVKAHGERAAQVAITDGKLDIAKNSLSAARKLGSYWAHVLPVSKVTFFSPAADPDGCDPHATCCPASCLRLKLQYLGSAGRLPSCTRHWWRMAMHHWTLRSSAGWASPGIAPSC